MASIKSHNMQITHEFMKEDQIKLGEPAQRIERAQHTYTNPSISPLAITMIEPADDFADRLANYNAIQEGSIISADEKQAVASINSDAHQSKGSIAIVGRELWILMLEFESAGKAFYFKLSAYEEAVRFFSEEYAPNLTAVQMEQCNYLAVPRDINDYQTIQVVRFIEAQ